MQDPKQISIDEITTGNVGATLEDVIAALPKDGRGNVDASLIVCDVCRQARAVTLGAWGKKFCGRCAAERSKK